MVFCKKGVLTNFAKFTKKHLRERLVFKEIADLQSFTLSKKRFRHRCFHVNSAKFLITLFLRNLSDGCFFCLLYHHDLSLFEKQCHTYFLCRYFLGLIYRLGTRVSSLFQALSQTPIFHPLKHFSKIVNSLKPLSIFAKNM